MIAKLKKPKSDASNPAGGACSTSYLGLILAGAPASTISKGGLHQKPLDMTEIMREKSST
jgi:hypothetical protein